MSSASARSGHFLLFGQLVLGATAIVAIATAPPAQGRMLVIPFGKAGEGDAIRIALDHGARLLDRGPLARSIVIVGNRGRLAGPLIAAGMGLMSAQAAGCGSESGT